MLTLFMIGLQVHFRSGVGGDDSVEREAAQLGSELDRVGELAREQAEQLERAHAQVEAHAAELQQLRARVLHAEQRLRAALAPNFSPRDRDHAEHEQQVCLLRHLSCAITFNCRRHLSNVSMRLPEYGNHQRSTEFTGSRKGFLRCFTYQDIILNRVLNYIYYLAIPLYIYKLPISKLEINVFFFISTMYFHDFIDWKV